jgi:DNA polymerase-4
VRSRSRWSIHSFATPPLAPGAIFVPPDFERHRAVSHSVREIFKRHTDLIEPLSLDEAYLDVTENKTGLPTATLVARSIREQIRLPGVGKVTGEKLTKREIQTVGDLRGIELPSLEADFGSYGTRLYELSRGVDRSEVVPDRPTKSISVEDTFEHAVPLAERDDDPPPCGKAVVRLAQGIADSTHRGAQTEN